MPPCRRSPPTTSPPGRPPTAAVGWPAIAEVVHVGDTAGVPQELVAGLLAAGVPARSIVLPTPLARAPRLLKAASLPLRLAGSRRVVADMRRSRAALVHVHYATAAVQYLRAGRPLVVHAHGTDVRNAGRVDRRLLDLVWRASALRLVATPDLAAFVPDAHYLPNPVDLRRFVAAGAAAAERDVLVFAALTEVKGAPLLVEAVRAIVAARPDLTVSAIGGGPYADAMAAAGATVVPPMPPDAVPAFLARHRVVLGQQRLGVLGVSELQAMATARPVVVHLRDAVSDYGTDAPPVRVAHAPDEIAAAALALLAGDDGADDLVVAARDWVARHHERDAVVARLLALYERHLGLSWPASH